MKVKVSRGFSKFECSEDIHFKTQPGPVAKNTTPRPPDGTELPAPSESLDQRSTN